MITIFINSYSEKESMDLLRLDYGFIYITTGDTQLSPLTRSNFSLYSWRFPLPYCSYKAAPAHPNSLNLPMPVKLVPSPT